MASTVSDKQEKEAREFASAVLTGTVIGRSLQDALQSLQREDSQIVETSDADETFNSEDEDGPPIREVVPKPPTSVKMTGGCMDSILQAFQEGISASKIHCFPEKDGAPRVLVKGRCDSYNRYAQNWMVAMDSVKLKGRPTKFRKRRRDDRPSLWDRDDDDNKNKNTQKEIVLKEKIQLLAYGDIA